MPTRKGLQKLFEQTKTDDWLSRVIDLHQERANPEKWGTGNPSIHPSSAGSSCSRDIELGMLGYRTAFAPKNRRRADNGTYAHERWERDLKEVGVLHSAEMRIKTTDPFFFSGIGDIIVQHPGTGQLLIGEIKTMNAARWRKVPDQMEDKVAMMRELCKTEKPYVLQLTQYVVMIPQVLGLDTEQECFFLFENTDTQEFKIRYCIPDEDLKEEAFKNPLEAQKAFLEKRLIAPPFHMGSLTCKLCYKREMCFKLQRGDEEAWEHVNSALNDQ